MHIEEIVRRDWISVFAGLGVTSTAWIDAEWSRVSWAYNDDRRHYHDMGHIAYGLGMMRKHRDLITNVLALKYAWIRHDEKYVAHARPKGLPTSEAWTTAIADEALADLNRLDLVAKPITMEFRQCVVDLISVTHHSDKFPPKTPDEKLLADIDWSPMAAPWPAFLRQRREIRAEFIQYSDEDFAVGRAGFIMELRGRASHFHLPQFKSLYDRQAKENIEKEVELLKLPWEEQARIMAAA